ncbi:hypothetical protein L9F63_019806 [Diploptera punctata]|uniref:Saccharopine dehydrogenase NADP binding domain-containing protein n=1 Tax=Diploptera punctata TaxID=6984 RepID=A0AAD7ZVJ6_DIPPU|nr:hypothetical protein L9F63_019806 [Diploptera punctata]
MAVQGERLDLIIFGATGFTGKVAVFEIAKLAKEKNVTWGVAGRNQSKLETVLKEVSEKSGEDVTKVPVIIADVGDEESLLKMAKQAKVILNCVGPYRFHGEAVVKSCLTGGAHHVDISGEPQYLERMQLEYNDMASDKGLYVVGACGLDSIPTDLGIVFMKKQFQGDVNSVEVYVEFGAEDPSKSEGAGLHYTTYESAVYGLAHANELRPLRTKLYPNRMPSMKPKLEPRSPIHNRDEIGWSIPFMGSDRSVIIRSQRHFYEVDKERPVQVHVYMVTKSLLKIMMLVFMGLIFLLLAKFRFGRSILLKKLKQADCRRRDQFCPTEKTRENSKYIATLFAEGWKEKASEPDEQHTTPPNKKVVAKVTCKDPGYGSTSVMLILSALTILKESDRMPGRGGVYPPGAAFAKTSLIDEMCKHGIKFEVTSNL